MIVALRKILNQSYSEINDIPYFEIIFGKDENYSNLDRVRKNPQLVIAIKSSASSIGFLKKPFTPIPP